VARSISLEIVMQSEEEDEGDEEEDIQRSSPIKSQGRGKGRGGSKGKSKAVRSPLPSASGPQTLSLATLESSIPRVNPQQVHAIAQGVVRLHEVSSRLLILILH
jgi:hypothetical protein